jgi:hypothetical protein
MRPRANRSLALANVRQAIARELLAGDSARRELFARFGC